MLAFSEDTYEQALIELFQSLEGKQYRYEYGPDKERDYTNPILDDVLRESLHRINPTLPLDAIMMSSLDNGCVKNYCDKVEDVITIILVLSKESARLATLRDTLLPKLMSGQIKILTK